MLNSSWSASVEGGVKGAQLLRDQVESVMEKNCGGCVSYGVQKGEPCDEAILTYNIILDTIDLRVHEANLRGIGGGGCRFLCVTLFHKMVCDVRDLEHADFLESPLGELACELAVGGARALSLRGSAFDFGIEPRI
jgi:hypothetical protein